MRRLALAPFCASIFALIAISGAMTVQLTVFCNGGIVYDNAVTVAGSNPTAWDAIKASGAGYSYDDSWGIFIKSIAGCGGNWGPAFYVNGGESSVGVGEYVLEDGDQLQFIGPNNDGPTAGILYLASVPGVVGKGEPFKIKVMERSAYSWGGYDRPSSGAEVTIGNETYQTGSNGYTEEIVLNYDAYYCVAAEKGGYVASYYFSDLPSIQCGIGGLYICSVIMGGSGKGRGNIKFDESSSVYGSGFSSGRSVYVNSGVQYPMRSVMVSQSGSGNYSADRITKQRPSGIDLSESLELEHNPTSFSVYNNNLSYKSKYETRMLQKNYHKASEYSEKYLQMDSLQRIGYYNNTLGINFTSLSNISGRAEFSSRTYAEDALINWTQKAVPKVETFEGYSGKFQILQRGFLPMNGNDDPDCKEECMWSCKKHCMEDLGYSDEYCEENCTDYCTDHCPSNVEEYELLPCCFGGWYNMTTVDRREHSAEGIFECASCKKR